MLNPENRPKLVIRPDGWHGHLPTNKGLKYTVEERRRKSRILKGKPHKDRRDTIEQSTVWNSVKPLQLRDGLVLEMSWITGLDVIQIRHAISKRRPEWQQATPTAVNDKTRTSVERKIETDNLLKSFLSPDEEKDILFARKLLEAGLITDDVFSWKDLSDFYKRGAREVPPRLYHRLRLEVFLKAKKTVNSGDRQLLDRYVAIGRDIDAGWFMGSLVEEQNFITSVFSTSHSSGVDGNETFVEFDHSDTTHDGSNGTVVFSNNKRADERRKLNREMVARGQSESMATILRIDQKGKKKVEAGVKS